VKNRNYKGRLLNAETPFAITEAFNSFRTNVIFSTSNCKGPVIAVTSSVSAEGKSLVCANLATSLSLLDKRVLLVECDMRCPSLSKIFDKEVETGLSELLAGITDNTDSVINRTSNENLDIVYCGKIPPNPSELLSSSVMKALVEKWKAEYDYVIMDLPPVCEVSDAGVIAELANGYVIAVRSNYSDLNEVRSCVSRIRSVDGAIMGFVVNDVNLKSGASYSSDYSRTYRHRSYYYRRDENQ
jgi:capsular exopolysaccharide synthesis family protein